VIIIKIKATIEIAITITASTIVTIFSLVNKGGKGGGGDLCLKALTYSMKKLDKEMDLSNLNKT